MSNHLNTPQNASDDSPNPDFAIQPQTRRERRLLDEAARQASVEPATVETSESPTPVSAATLFHQAEHTSGPIPHVEPQQAQTSGPIPFVDATPSGSTAAITAPDVAILTPIVPTDKTKRVGRVGAVRAGLVRKVRLRPEGTARKTRGFVPRAGQMIRRLARETWSTTIRGFVVLVIGAFMVTLTLPSTGFNLDLPGYAAPDSGERQEVTTASNSDVATTVALGEFKISNYGDLLARRFGSGNWSYTVTNTGPIRWPFPYAAPISSGFGARVAPCASCSTYHQGLDIDPADGSPIYAVADGVVVKAADDSWGYGVWVLIRHKVGSVEFESVYAHMERGSVELKVGDTVKVSDYVGRTGNTGASTGVHLHLEIRVDGQQVDPFAWLKKNAK